MLFRTPGRLTKGQIAIVASVGVLAGVYIWKPAFQKFAEEQRLEYERLQQLKKRHQEAKENLINSARMRGDGKQ